jgi:beta-glucosidase-like glycosyl hydrolase/CubicO group peptidase (beta-lactamase class C family)
MRYRNILLFFELLITIHLLWFQPSVAFSQVSENEISKAEVWADSVYQSLTLEEKIAQLFFARANQSGEPYIEDVGNYIKNYNIGGVVFFRADPISQALKTNEWNALAKTPLFIAIDAEWGLGMRLSNTVSYPLQMTLGAIENEALLYQMGAEIAAQSKRIGIHINFAPVVDVNNNPANPVIGMRSFGEDPANVSLKAYHYMKGMQDHGLIACAKHFPGHGNTDIDSHVDLPVINASRNELKDVELFPFQYLVDNGVSAVMVAHLSVPSLDHRKNMPASLSDKIVDGYLKHKMDFKGLIIPDGLDMQGVTKHYKKNEVALEALKAGNDVLLIPEDIPASIEAIKEAILKGKVSAERLEESCKKVLKYKYLSGAWKKIPVETTHLLTDLNKPEYAKTADNLFAEAVTVVRNQEEMIPLAYPDTLLPALIIIGTENETIFEKPLSAFLPFRVFRLSHDANVHERQTVLNALEEYNLVVVAIVNTHILSSKNFGVTDGDVQFINHVARKKPVILNVFASPYTLNAFGNTNIFKAIVVSYQDKPYMQQVSAEVITGAHKAAGKLPVSAGGFKAGTGFSIKKTRLSYTTPDELGIDRMMLSRIDSIALNGIEIKAYPGCQVLAAKDGYIFYEKSFGYHTYDKKYQVKNDDIYDLASLTKILATTPAIMQMYDAGLIDIHGKLSDYLLYLKGTNKSELGFREVMAHQAGLQSWIPYYENTILNTAWDTAIYRSYISENFPFRVANNMYIQENYHYDIYNEIIQSPLDEKEYNYSDLGFYLFRDLIEQANNIEFDDYVYQHFYDPMGLKNLRFQPRKYFSLSRIIPTEYDRLFRHQLLQGDVHDQGAAMLGGISGHAGLFGNAHDVAVMMQMFLNGGNYGGRQFINKETVALFTSYQFPENDNRRGLGFDKPLLEFEEHRTNCRSASPASYGHSGFTGTYTWADPETGLIYVFLSNRIYPDMENKKIMNQDIRTNIHQLFYEAIGIKAE